MTWSITASTGTTAAARRSGVSVTTAEATGCRVRRLGAPRIPVGYSPVLEAQSRVTAADIAASARGLLGTRQ
ncbi:hypothetical protein GCM10028813_51540 [Ramlibacter alkalitolerans]